MQDSAITARAAVPDAAQGQADRRDMSIVIVGHVDHGKSTIIGRLLADTGSLPQGKLEQVREMCRRNSKPFEYAFLLDALKDERDQGITIDSARVFFKTALRRYIIIDAPGHVEFLKNMVTGASRAEAALLVIDASEGIRENSKRHGYMLSMLGIRQITVLINKMDLVNYDERAFLELKEAYEQFLESINVRASSFIPVSGMHGDNIALRSPAMPWYRGKTVLETLDGFSNQPLPVNKPFRMPVQGVYRFTENNDRRRIIAGTVETGRLSVGDTVVFYPSGKQSRVKTIEAFNAPLPKTVEAGQATGFTLEEQIYVRRGEIAAHAGEPRPRVTTRLRANLFWLGKSPMTKDKRYILKLGTARAGARLSEILHVLDASDLRSLDKEKIDPHDVAECILELETAIAFDTNDAIPQTSRFVIVDGYEISGGGIIQEALEDKQSWVREKVLVRNARWERSEISPEERAEKYNQKATLILITGRRDAGKKPTARALEKRLFRDGKFVYFLGIGNLLYGVDADLKWSSNNHREEHIRRLAEVANVMLDAGMILIVTATELTQDDIDLMRTAITTDRIETVWIGEEITTDIECSLHIPHLDSTEAAAEKIRKLLVDRGAIFSPV